MVQKDLLRLEMYQKSNTQKIRYSEFFYLIYYANVITNFSKIITGAISMLYKLVSHHQILWAKNSHYHKKQIKSKPVVWIPH